MSKDDYKATEEELIRRDFSDLRRYDLPEEMYRLMLMQNKLLLDIAKNLATLVEQGRHDLAFLAPTVTTPLGKATKGKP